MTRRTLPFIATLALIVAAMPQAPAGAATITPTAATATSSLDANRDISHVIDGSGLSGVGDLLDQTHNGTTVNGEYWLGTTADDQVLTFTLDEPSNVNGIDIWQYERDHADWDYRALQSFDISFSTDNGATYPVTIAGLTGLLGGPDITPPIQVQTLEFAPQSNVTNIRLSNLANFGNGQTFYGLAEVRFEANTVPEPSTIALALLGLIPLAGWSVRRRNRRQTAVGIG